MPIQEGKEGGGWEAGRGMWRCVYVLPWHPGSPPQTGHSELQTRRAGRGSLRDYNSNIEMVRD